MSPELGGRPPSSLPRRLRSCGASCARGRSSQAGRLTTTSWDVVGPQRVSNPAGNASRGQDVCLAGFELRVPACLVGVVSVPAPCVNFRHPVGSVPRAPPTRARPGPRAPRTGRGHPCALEPHGRFPSQSAGPLGASGRCGQGWGRGGPRHRDGKARDTGPPVWAPRGPSPAPEPGLEASAGPSARVPCVQRAKVKPVPAGGARGPAPPPRAVRCPPPGVPLWPCPLGSWGQLRAQLRLLTRSQTPDAV